MSRILADPALDAAFGRDGYVAVPLLDDVEIAALLADIATLHPADGFAPDGSGRAGNTYHCSFLDASTAYKRATFDLLSRHFQRAVDRHLAGFRIVTANFYVKPPGRGDLRIHQNWPVLDLDQTSVTIWCPLVDVDERNGTLEVVPASHKLVPHIESATAPSYFSAFIERVPDYMISLPVPAGSGFIFDDSLVHGSPANAGTRPRIAVQVMCIPKDATPVFFFKESEARFERIAADVDFYLDQDLEDIVVRRPEWQSLGHVDNRNRLLDEEEFAALLVARGRGERRTSRGVGPAPSRPPLAQRLAAMIRAVARRVVPDQAKPHLRRLLGRASPR